MKVGTWLLSCEHGGKRVPAAYRALFAGEAARSALDSHRGCDIGALRLAKRLAADSRIRLYAAEATRLLVDLNRSIGHRALFSEFSAALDDDARRVLLQRYYLPHREAIERAIARSAHFPVCHVGVHSFTPVHGGKPRRADLALLYDPGRRLERALCERWKGLLAELAPALTVRRNYPYRGVSDGLTTALRRRFGATAYLGIELEVNQSLLSGDSSTRRGIERTVAASLRRLRDSVV